MMKNTIHYAFVALCLVMCSCYGLKDETYKDLAPIEISGIDPVIYIEIQETLHLEGIKIKSDNNQLNYEWCYGSVDNDFPKMADTTFVSNKLNIDAAFAKAGNYVLRLKVDNGESIVFNYYELRVQSSFDEGIMVLCNDNNQNGKLAFIKKRSPQEVTDNKQEIWDNLFDINPEFEFKNVNDIFFFASNAKAVAEVGSLVTTSDAYGSIFKLDPVTFEVTSRVKMKEEYGTNALLIGGENTSATAHFCYMVGEDKRIYRYDISADIPAWREAPNVDRIYQGYNYSGENSKGRYPYMYSETHMAGATAQPMKFYKAATGYKILNVAANRVEIERIVMIMRSETNPRTISFTSISGSFSGPKTYGEYTASSDILMDENSIMVNTKLDPDNVYYSFDNKIYHWAVKNYTNPKIPITGDRADISLPDGEQIMSMCTTGVPTTLPTSIDDDRLIIATFNSTVTGRKPGSVYVYNLRDMSLDKKYEGVCEKPVKVAYKFLTSL